MMQLEIKSKTHGSHIVLLDDSDYEKIKGVRWNLKKSTTGLYYARGWIYLHDKPRKNVFMHRLIMDELDQVSIIDHRDNNGLNNQRKNLRIVTFRQNLSNSRIRRNNTTGFKGVSVLPADRKKFRVYIHHENKYKFGGIYDTAVDAAKRYNELARQYHGEFAYQNPV